MGVKRCFTLAWFAVLLTAASVAQVHGVPASVTSPRSDGMVFTPSGIPASVSSLGPQGYGRPTFNDRFIPTGPLRRDRLGRVILQAPIPLFYPVAYYPVYVAPSANASYVERVVEPSANRSEPQKIILEIRDARPSALTVAAKDSKEPEKKPAPRNDAESPRAATVFIFRDGSRKELKDFAITETELIDLSEGRIHRSPLDSLDRPATLKANAENGVEVHFPSASSD